jgi:RNA polymerase sigma-70 factor (ECF subfamily)
VTAAAPTHYNGRNDLGADTTRLLYERHRQRIFGYCLSRLRDRQEAEDAVQNTFVYAFRLLNRGVVPDAELPWLFAIARNVCRSRRRTLGRRGRVETVTDLDALQDAVSARSTSAPDELHGLSDALAAMPESQRRALLLREWQGLSYAEIGQTLALSQSAVETLLFRARRSLANRLAPASDKVAVMLNGFVLLRLARRLVRGGFGAKTATAAVAVGFAAGAGVPLERSLHQPPMRAPTVIATEQTDRTVRSAPAPSVALTASANARQPHVAKAETGGAQEAPAADAAPHADAPTAQSAPSGAEAPANPSAQASTGVSPGSAVDKASALLRVVTTSPSLPALPGLPQPPQLDQTVATGSAALDLPPANPADLVTGSTGSAPLPAASPPPPPNGQIPPVPQLPALP